MAKIETLYPTAMYVEDRIGNFDDVQEEMKECLKGVKFSFHEGWGTHWLSNLEFTENTLLQSMPLFAAELSKHIEAYCNAMKFFDKTYVEIKSSWFSKFKKGNHAHIHNHKGADISGVYYFKSTGDDGKIFFTTPNQYTEMSDVWSSDRFSHSSDEGKLLLFPGYLKHGVTTNITSSTRISFSFNLKVHEWVNE